METKKSTPRLSAPPPGKSAKGSQPKPVVRGFVLGGEIESDLASKGISLMDGIVTNSNLSSRQKANQMLGVGSSMATMGIDPGIIGRIDGISSGLSPNRLTGLQTSAFGLEAGGALSQPQGLQSFGPAAAPETTFQQDSDARQSRITAYADRLKGMETAARTDPNTLHAAYADGGAVSKADQLMAEMAAKYGVSGNAQPAPPAVQQPAPQPQPKAQPLPQQQGLTPGIIGIVKGRAAQIDKAAGYRHGGIIKGPGTPTSDSIPATVKETGEGIAVSTDERIVSKAQSDLLDAVARSAGYDSLDHLFEGFGLPVGPTIKGGKRAAATGMAPEDEQRPEARGIDGSVAAALAAPPTLGGAPLARSEPAGGGLAKAAQAAGYRPEVNGIVWGAKGFDPTKENMAPGTGAIAITSGPNAGKNIAVGPQNYTAADGTPTSDWSKTSQYAQGVAQAQKDRDTLAGMQRDRLERDAYDPSITDPTVQANARAQIAESDRMAALKGVTSGRLLDNQIKQTKLASDGAMAGLQAQYLNEQDPVRRNQIAEQIRAVTGKGEGAPAWQHVETEKGVMAFNPKTLRMEPVRGPDGQQVASTKPLTEYQGKSTGFGLRADAASRVIDTVGQGGKVQPSLIKRAAEAVPLIGDGLGMAANGLQSPEQQQVEQAQRDFVNAVLRQESGAAISASEFDNARKQYFPQPNDTPEVVAQKQRNREAAINGFRISAGPGAKNIGSAPAQGQPSAGPQVGTVDGKHVYLGGNPADPASWAEVR